MVNHCFQLLLPNLIHPFNVRIIQSIVLFTSNQSITGLLIILNKSRDALMTCHYLCKINAWIRRWKPLCIYLSSTILPMPPSLSRTRTPNLPLFSKPVFISSSAARPPPPPINSLASPGYASNLRVLRGRGKMGRRLLDGSRTGEKPGRGRGPACMVSERSTPGGAAMGAA